MNLLLQLIRMFEGLRLRAYLCPAAVPTIGYGATGPDIKLGLVWTNEQAEARLATDADGMVNSVKRLCPEIVGDEGKLAAIADFAFNLGPTRLAGSTLRRRIKAGDYDGAAVELMKWVRGGGKVLPGLVLRRMAERNLFLGVQK